MKNAVLLAAVVPVLAGCFQTMPLLGDDGEKFGVWPGTKKHVFQDGWLRRFLESLRENSDWIRLLTFSQAMERGTRPARIYIPDASYREMTEWALPSRRLADFRDLESKLGRAGFLDQARPYFGGGMWRTGTRSRPMRRSSMPA